MEDGDPPTRRTDAAHALAHESLDRLSVEELNARVAALEAEIVRVIAHRDRSAAHRLAADALFGRAKT